MVAPQSCCSRSVSHVPVLDVVSWSPVEGTAWLPPDSSLGRNSAASTMMIAEDPAAGLGREREAAATATGQREAEAAAPAALAATVLRSGWRRGCGSSSRPREYVPTGAAATRAARARDRPRMPTAPAPIRPPRSPSLVWVMRA